MKDLLTQKRARGPALPQDEPKWRRTNTRLTIRPTIDNATWKELRSHSALVALSENDSCEVYRYLGPAREEGICTIHTGSVFFFSSRRDEYSWTTFVDSRHEVGALRPSAPPSSCRLPELVHPSQTKTTANAKESTGWATIRSKTAKSANNAGWASLVQSYKEREAEKWRHWSASSQASASDTRSDASNDSCNTPHPPSQGPVSGGGSSGSISPANTSSSSCSQEFGRGRGSSTTVQPSRASGRKKKTNPFAGNNSGRLGREIAFAMVATDGQPESELQEAVQDAAPAVEPVPEVGSPAKEPVEEQEQEQQFSETGMMLCEDKASGVARAAGVDEKTTDGDDDVAQYLFDTDDEAGCDVDLEDSCMAEIEGSGDTSGISRSASGAPAAKRNKLDVLLAKAKAITAGYRGRRAHSVSS